MLSVSAAGGGSPDSGFYAATIESVEANQKNAFSRKMKLKIGGFNTSYFMNTPYDAQGQKYPGITDDKARGMLAYTKAVFESAGYNDEVMANGVTDDWLIGRTCYVEWHNAKDLGAQYGEISRFIPQVQFETFQAEGTKPVVASRDNTDSNVAPAPPASTAAVPAQVVVAAAPPVPQAAAAPMPATPTGSNGIGGVAVPPPPSSMAQTIGK